MAVLTGGKKYMNSTAGRMIGYFGAASAVANPALIFAPVLVGGAVSTLGFSTVGAVGIVSAELLSTALASIPALWWVVNVNWRTVAVVALLATILGNFASVFSASLEALMLIRTLTGLFEGTLLALYMAIIAKSPQPERIFGGKLALQMFAGAVGLALFPAIIDTWGVQGVYAILGTAAMALLPGIRNFPVGDGTGAADRKLPVNQGASGWWAERWEYSVLALLFVFGTAVNGIWTFLERVGTGYGLSLEVVGWAASLSTILAIVSSMICAMLGTRLGSTTPISTGLLLGIGGAVVLATAGGDVALFILGASLVTIARVVPVPYIFGFVAQLDRRGKLAVLSHIAVASGMAAGPVLAVPVFTRGGVEAVLIVGALFLGATWVLALKLAKFVSTRETQSVECGYS